MASVFETISNNPILTGLFLMAVGAMFPKVRGLMRSVYRWVAGQFSALTETLRNETTQDLRSQMQERAEELGITVPVSRSGHRPEAWKYSNGATLYYYGGDLHAYKRDMTLSAVPTRGAHHGDPPKQIVLNEMSRRQIKNWLREHPSPKS